MNQFKYLICAVEIHKVYLCDKFRTTDVVPVKIVLNWIPTVYGKIRDVVMFRLTDFQRSTFAGQQVEYLLFIFCRISDYQSIVCLA